jgi:hypothetical protein
VVAVSLQYNANRGLPIASGLVPAINFHVPPKVPVIETTPASTPPLQFSPNCGGGSASCSVAENTRMCVWPAAYGGKNGSTPVAPSPQTSELATSWEVLNLTFAGHPLEDEVIGVGIGVSVEVAVAMVV